MYIRFDFFFVGAVVAWLYAACTLFFLSAQWSRAMLLRAQRLALSVRWYHLDAARNVRHTLTQRGRRAGCVGKYFTKLDMVRE